MVEIKIPNIKLMANPLKIGSSIMNNAPIIAANAVNIIGFALTAPEWITACYKGTPAAVC